jgi:hypothetical protein
MARVPILGSVYGEIRTGVRKSHRIQWVQEVVERPPYFLEDFLQPEIWAGIRGGRLNDLLPYRFFLERILILGDYFS